MSDELDITYGGAISVDTEVLRDVGSRMARLVSDFDEARAAVHRAHGIISDIPELSECVNTAALLASGQHAGTLRDEMDDAAGFTLLMADAYEVVELRAQADALAVTDAAAAAVLQARVDQLMAGDRRVGIVAAVLVGEWASKRYQGLDAQFAALGLPGMFAGALLRWFAQSGPGKVWPWETLRGKVDPVKVTAVKTTTPTHAPDGFAAAFRRFPKASGAQVRVEKYIMADRSAHFVAYVTGTRNSNPFEAGGSEPWDMKSNAELYGGEASASYQATLDALAAAGAKPGDSVGIFAHSQAGMIAAHLANESPYKVEVVVTAGSPQEVTVRDDQLLVQFQHPDDVIKSLAGGGSPGGSGSPGSMIVTRVADPAVGIQDAQLKAHVLETYIETAEQLDASDDPRAQAAQDYFAKLDEAVSIESTQYRAERVEE